MEQKCLELGGSMAAIWQRRMRMEVGCALFQITFTTQRFRAKETFSVPFVWTCYRHRINHLSLLPSFIIIIFIIIIIYHWRWSPGRCEFDSLIGSHWGYVSAISERPLSIRLDCHCPALNGHRGGQSTTNWLIPANRMEFDDTRVAGAAINSQKKRHGAGRYIIGKIGLQSFTAGQ